MSTLQEPFNALKAQADELYNELEGIKDAEQEAYDNMPESLQNGDRGQASADALSHMETALTLLETIKDLDDFNDALSALDEAEHV